MRRVILLRHGITAANEERRYCGVSDVPLSDGGRTALLEMGQRLVYPPLDACVVYTSGLRRTEETLELLYGKAPHIAVSDLREMDFGVFELQSYEELKEDPRYLQWIAGENEKNRCPGGESGVEMSQRVLRAFAEVSARGDCLIVTHGGPIAAIMAELFPDEGKNRYEWQPANGCGYEIQLGEGSPVWQPCPQET